MSADRENFCDYCKHYLHEDDLCALTGRKPAFESECADYNEKKGVVKKDFNRKESALERNVFNIVKVVCAIGLMIFMIYNLSGIKDMLLSPLKKAVPEISLKKAVPEIKIKHQFQDLPKIVDGLRISQPYVRTTGAGTYGQGVTSVIDTGSVLNKQKSTVVDDILKEYPMLKGGQAPYTGSK